jgi:hypothetical protein
MTEVLRRTAVLVLLAVCGFITGSVLMDVALAQVQVPAGPATDTKVKTIVLRCTVEQAPCTFNVEVPTW